ncbi:unnamed protein product [Symbiodinium sp. KB8]|nr:unnamed protein product [Symbiodinium sp. KB8]
MDSRFQPWCGECACETTVNEEMQWTRSRFSVEDEHDSMTSSQMLGDVADRKSGLDASGCSICVSPQRPDALVENRISQRLGPYLEVEAELLRGVALCKTLRGMGWMWRRSPHSVPEEKWQFLWQSLRPVNTYDVFISHTWKSSGLSKVLALLLSTGWHSALAFWLLAILVIVTLQVCFPDLDNHKPFVLSKRIMNFEEACPLAPWAVIATPLAMTLGVLLAPYLPQKLMKEGTCFLDVACIHQADPALKERGIYGIGGFLQHAAELRVLWTPPYLTRLWCIFELAAYRVANPTGRITLTPIFIEHSVLFLAPALWVASSCYWAAAASGLNKYGFILGEALPIGIALIPLVGFVQGLRRFFCAKHKLFEELRAFKLASAECSELFDQIFVISAIQKWYGSAEEFEKFVQGTLYSEMSNIQTVDVPLPYCLLLTAFPVSATIDETLSLWAGGAPMPVVASSLIGHVYGICVCWCLVSFKLLYYLCDRFAVARHTGFADYLQTLLIYLSFSLFFLVGSYTGELAYRHSLETAICHACLCLVGSGTPFGVSSQICNQRNDDCVFLLYKVHCDSLLQALELAGFTILRQAWLDEVVSQITRYNSLDLDEFLQMLHMYEERHYAEFAKVFEHFDDDQSGTLEAHELANLLEQCGITALDQVLKEIMVEVAPADPGSITMEEFKRVIEIIHVNEGFSSREIIKLKEVFRKFDLDRGGTMDTSELHKAMAWLGHGLTKEEVQLISDSCDVGGKGVLEECEFFGFMRKVKEKEILMVKRELKKQRPVGGAVPHS